MSSTPPKEFEKTVLQRIDPDLEIIPFDCRLSKDGTADVPPREHLVTEDEVELLLHRKPNPGAPPVLLLHGASAGADTFLTPRPGSGGGTPNFVDYLFNHGFEPWLLDWRSSHHVVERLKGRSAGEVPKGELFNFNDAAKHDIKAAIAAIDIVMMKERRGKPLPKIAAVGFCMGSAILAEALLQAGTGEEDQFDLTDRLSHVVLMTIGLFYQMNLNGRLKAEAHLLQRVIADQKKRRFLDPTVVREDGIPAVNPATGETRWRLVNPWPGQLEKLYQAWRHPYARERLLQENIMQRDCYVREMFNRISFMFGEPYQEGNLIPEIHNTITKLTIEGGDGEGLSQGTRIEVKDGAKTIASGELAYDFSGAPDSELALWRCKGRFEEGQRLFADGQSIGNVGRVNLDEPLLPTLFGPMALHLHQHGAENLRRGVATLQGGSDALPEPLINGSSGYGGFDRLDRLALVSGGLNRLWHRDCIDRMAEWLARNPKRRRHAWKKHVFIDYGHQDLLWGKCAATDIFPTILSGLPDAKSSERDQPLEEKGDQRTVAAGEAVSAA